MKRSTLALAFAACTLWSLPAFAQLQHPKFYISGGLFPTSFSTEARLSSVKGDGTNVDLEDDLGLDSQLQNLRIEGYYRFRPKHRFEFGYTSWRRNAEKDISRNLIWGDTTYLTGASIRAINNAQFVKLAYRYSFFQTDRTEIDFSAGIDAVWNKTRLEGKGQITDDAGRHIDGIYSETYNYIAPAPVFGLNVTYAAQPKVVLRGSAEYFGATIEEITAKVIDVRASADYLFTPTWGAGLGYSYVGYKAEKNDFDAQFDFSGPIIYVSYRR